MNRTIMLAFGALVAGALGAPTALHAQVPVVLVCNDGSMQPGPTRTACESHRGTDWQATNKWTKIRSGHYAATDTVVCMDGQAAAAGRQACASQGGVDSVSTVAAIRRRKEGNRFEQPADSSGGGASGNTGRTGAQPAPGDTAGRPPETQRTPPPGTAPRHSN